MTVQQNHKSVGNLC